MTGLDCAGLRWGSGMAPLLGPLCLFGQHHHARRDLGRAGGGGSVDEAGLACRAIVHLGLEYWQPAAIIDAMEAEAEGR